MTFHLHLHDDSSDGPARASLKQLETRLMSMLSAKIADTNASFDAALGRVQGVVEALHAKVADLEDDIAKGVATDEDLAALDALRNRIDALDPTKPAILPDEPADESSPIPEV